jgi:hypothetical protein
VSLSSINEQLSRDPTGRMMLTSDNRGRIYLFRLPDCFLIRIWKGHRAAEYGWVTGFSNGVWQSLVVIASHNRHCIDVWPVHHGGRLASVRMPSRSTLMFVTKHDSHACVESAAGILLLTSDESQAERAAQEHAGRPVQLWELTVSVN